MAKIDFTSEFLDVDGAPLFEAVFESGAQQFTIDADKNKIPVMRKLLFKTVAIQILSDTYIGDDNVPSAERIDRFWLAKKIGRDSKNYTKKETALILDLANRDRPNGAGKRPTLVLGNFDELFNGTHNDDHRDDEESEAA
jgi:hypothetical protein